MTVLWNSNILLLYWWGKKARWCCLEMA